MTKEDLIKEAEEYATHFSLDLRKDRKATEQWLTAKYAYIDGHENGYKKGLKTKVNLTTISDAPRDDQELKEQLEGSRAAKEVYKKKSDRAEEIIKLLLWDLRNKDYNPEKDIEKAEDFLGRNA